MHLQCKRFRFNPWMGKFPLEKRITTHSSILFFFSFPTPVFLPGEFHGQRAGNSPWGLKESDMTEQLTHIIRVLKTADILMVSLKDFWRKEGRTNKLEANRNKTSYNGSTLIHWYRKTSLKVFLISSGYILGIGLAAYNRAIQSDGGNKKVCTSFICVWVHSVMSSSLSPYWL